MDVGSDAGESQQAEVVETSKTNASISRWSSDLKSDSSMVFASYSATQKAAWRPSVLNDKTCAVEASMCSCSFPTSLISLPRTRFQTSNSSQSTRSIPSPSASPSLDSLPVTPDDPGATFATKRLTINTDNRTTTYYRHSVAMRTDASPPQWKPPQSSHPRLHASSPTSPRPPFVSTLGTMQKRPTLRCETIWSIVPSSKFNPHHNHGHLIEMVPFYTVVLCYPGSVTLRQWTTASHCLPSTRLLIPCPSPTIMLESSPSYWMRPPT